MQRTFNNPRDQSLNSTKALPTKKTFLNSQVLTEQSQINSERTSAVKNVVKLRQERDVYSAAT